MQGKMVVGFILALAAINWGLVGLLDVNLVEAIFGSGTMPTQVVYILVGAVGVYKMSLILMKSLGGKK